MVRAEPFLQEAHQAHALRSSDNLKRGSKLANIDLVENSDKVRPSPPPP